MLQTHECFFQVALADDAKGNHEQLVTVKDIDDELDSMAEHAKNELHADVLRSHNQVISDLALYAKRANIPLV